MTFQTSHRDPLDELVAWANSANEHHRDEGRHELAGRDLGTLLTELQAHALTAGGADWFRPVVVVAPTDVADCAWRLLDIDH